ncbi:MAG: tetratricopeptide repeat protein [Spirochaetaceae bacterium]
MKKYFMLLLMLSLLLKNVIANDLQLFEAGKKAFSVGLYTIALENLDAYIKTETDKKRVDAIYLSGISAYYLKNYKKSLSYLTGIEKYYKDSAYVNKTFYWIGLNNYHLDHFDLAIKWFLKNTKIDSSYNDISWLFMALSNLKINNQIEAVECFNTLINSNTAKDRYKEEALFRLSTLYIENDQIGNAINTLNKLVFDYSDSKYFTDSLKLLSEAYFKIEEWQNAKRIYLLLLEDSNNNESIYKRLATINLNIGNLKQSKMYLELYNDEIGIDKQILFMLADVSVRLGENDNAISIYTKIKNEVELTIGEVNENNYRLGTLYYQKSDFKKSYISFSEVDSKEAIYFTVLSGINSGEQVIKYIKKMNTRFPSDKLTFDLINRYINYLQNESRLTDLESFLIFATESYPENLTYSLTYGELLLETDELDKSLKYLSKGFYPESPYYSNIAYKIGWIYFNKEEYNRSIGFFDLIKPTDNDYNKALYSKSISQYKIGDLKDGKKGFITLLDLETIYSEEVSFYLGMIEKDNYNYELAIEYFNESLKKESLYINSLDNIAWCHYHLEQYREALEYYDKLYDLEKLLIYKFNSANCHLFLENYNLALDLYIDVSKSENLLKSSSYYKTIEIFFKLKDPESGYIWFEKYQNEFPKSDLPSEVVFTYADNNLYNGDIDTSIVAYEKIISLLNKNYHWYKARYRLSEAFYIKKEYTKSIELYIQSIIDQDKYYKESIIKIITILSEVSNPDLTKNTIVLLDNIVEDRADVVSIYIEAIRQEIDPENVFKNIASLITIAKTREDIDQLIYLRALNFYNIGNIETSQENLIPILSRSEVFDDTKIDGLLLQGLIYQDQQKFKEAIDLYLNLYVNFPDNTEKASNALYKGLLLSKSINDTDTFSKIKSILSTEYIDTTWGERSLNE